MSSILTGSISLTFVPVAQRIRHLTTNQGIVGSNPTGDVFITIRYKVSFYYYNFKLIIIIFYFKTKHISTRLNKKVPPPGFEPGSHG